MANTTDVNVSQIVIKVTANVISLGEVWGKNTRLFNLKTIFKNVQ